mmetsp:Transcript_14167/g.27041  ORF Transcript_14167/g.27041 Transcript_14167/m.27041 type:complete len:81 (+) Transcript_14167:21-263(+)
MTLTSGIIGPHDKTLYSTSTFLPLPLPPEVKCFRYNIQLEIFSFQKTDNEQEFLFVDWNRMLLARDNCPFSIISSANQRR